MKMDTSTTPCGSPSPGHCPLPTEPASPGTAVPAPATSSSIDKPVGQANRSPEPSSSISYKDQVAPSSVSYKDQVAPSSVSYKEQVAPSRSLLMIPRGGGRRFSVNQLSSLRELYVRDPYPSREEYGRLGEQLGLSIKSVQIWFQNRRTQVRKQSSPLAFYDDTASDDAKHDHDDGEDGVTSDDSSRSRSVSPRSEQAHSGPGTPSGSGTSGGGTSSDDAGGNEGAAAKKKRARTDPWTSAQTEYAPMTAVLLPPDHPFCRLMPSEPTRRRARVAAKCPSPELLADTAASSIVARLQQQEPQQQQQREQQQREQQQQQQKQQQQQQKHKQQQQQKQTRAGRNRRRAQREARFAEHTQHQSESAATAGAGTAAAADLAPVPTTSRLWRPLDSPRAPALPRPLPDNNNPSTSPSPLDLSVPVKRKQDARQDPGASPQAAHRALPAGLPMVYPGAFPFYHPASAAYLHPMMHLGQVPFSLPLGLYGQPVGVWNTGLPCMTPTTHSPSPNSVK